MYEIEIYSPNLDVALRNLAQVPEKIAESQRSGLSSVGYMGSTEAREFIEAGGTGGNATHPVTRYLEDRAGRWHVRKREKPIAYSGLGKFARYLIVNRSSLLLFGFGTFKDKDVKRGKALRFDPRLQDYAKQMQRGKQTPVTASMRKKFGASRGVLGSNPGKTFFPIRNTTTTLVSPKRSLGTLVNRIAAKSAPIFMQKFTEAFARRMKKLDY